MMKINQIWILLLILVLSCGKSAESENNETVDKGSYFIVIDGKDGKIVLDATGEVETIWNAETGFIYLGTAEDTEYQGAIGTLTLNLAYEDFERKDKYLLYTALVSKTDQRTGTAEQLNARMYELKSGYIDDAETGANFIKGNIDLIMDRVIVDPEDDPEVVTVKGTFVAKSK